MAYFRIDYVSDCAVGSIPSGYAFWLYLDGELGEPIEEAVEEGEEDGAKNFIPFFRKSTKKYYLETDQIPVHVIDAINRIKYFSTVTITNSLGEVKTMKNIKTDVTYPFTDKTYGIVKIEFDIDEVLMVTGCC